MGLLKDIPVLKIIVTDSTFTVYQKGINKVDMNGMMPSSTRLFYGLKCMETKAIISMKRGKDFHVPSSQCCPCVP